MAASATVCGLLVFTFLVHWYLPFTVKYEETVPLDQAYAPTDEASAQRYLEAFRQSITQEGGTIVTVINDYDFGLMHVLYHPGPTPIIGASQVMWHQTFNRIGMFVTLPLFALFLVVLPGCWLLEVLDERKAAQHATP